MCVNVLTEPTQRHKLQLQQAAENVSLSVVTKRSEDALFRYPLFVIAVLASALALVGPVAADGGVTAARLTSAGWTCFTPPPAPNRIVCGKPGLGLPAVPADPNGPAAYSFLTFDRTTGELLGATHMIRADLYHGQPCPQLGGLYTFNPLNGYYRCEVY
jgi:hypothetical protein